MKKYILCTQYNEENIQKRFFSMFGVDIKQYQQGENLKENWEKLIKDVFSRQVHGDSEDKIERFMLLVNYLADGGEEDVIIRGKDECSKKREKVIDELNKIVSDMFNMSEDYYLMESDVFMNAYLSIKYIEANKHELKDLDRKGIIMMDREGEVVAKGMRFKIPFENLMETKDFCIQYQKYLLGKDTIQIFATGRQNKKKKCEVPENNEELEENSCMEKDILEKKIDIQNVKDFCGYKQRIKIDFPDEWDYKRWARNKILETEQQLQMEDKMLFFKTIDGMLPRNMVDLMIISNRRMNAYDYVYLMDWLCICNSVNWKNIIGIITVFSCIYKDTLRTIGILERVQLCIDIWITCIRTVNGRIKCLSDALVYMAYHEDNIEYIKDKCQRVCDELGKFPSVYNEIYKGDAETYCKEVWGSQPEKLKLKANEKVSPTDYWCIYAIFQWRIVDNLKVERGKKMRAKWYSMGNLVYRFSGLQNEIEDTEKLDEMCRSNIGENDLVIKVGGVKKLIEISKEIFSSIIELLKKQESEVDFFQMLGSREKGIQKLFCNKVHEKSDIEIAVDGKEMKKLRIYMLEVIDLVDDKIKYPPK